MKRRARRTDLSIDPLLCLAWAICSTTMRSVPVVHSIAEILVGPCIDTTACLALDRVPVLRRGAFPLSPGRAGKSGLYATLVSGMTGLRWPGLLQPRPERPGQTWGRRWTLSCPSVVWAAPTWPRTIADPYLKDYDAIDGEGPQCWPGRFDVSNWGLICARRDGAVIGGAVIAIRTPGLHMLRGRHHLAVLWI